MIDDFDDLLFDEESPQPSPSRPWYLLTGLVIGLALGLAFAWALSPVRYTDTHPASLRTEFKDEYRLLIARAYQANDNPGRALQRLALLEDSDPAAQLAAQEQQLTANGRLEDAGALESLAEALAAAAERTPIDLTSSPPAVSEVENTAATDTPTITATGEPTATFDPSQAIRTLTPSPAPTQTNTPTAGLTATVTPTAMPQSTVTAQPSATPRATQTTQASLPAAFRLLSQQQVCDPGQLGGLLQIEVLDSAGRPLAGVRVTVRWDGGSEAFRTGLYSELSAGYADFAMQPEVEYSLSAGEGGENVTGLSAPLCEEAGSPDFHGGWLVQFGV